MVKEVRKKITTVRDHPMRVPVSEKNPTGITVRDRHVRRLKGTYLDAAQIAAIFKEYNRKGITFPSAGKLKHKNADNYDDHIAIWTDYFNKKALGIMQIIPMTLKIAQDQNGEAKDFILKKSGRKI
jgi:hypothetical protein